MNCRGFCMQLPGLVMSSYASCHCTISISRVCEPGNVSVQLVVAMSAAGPDSMSKPDKGAAGDSVSLRLLQL
jgi:hypothetical protein